MAITDKEIAKFARFAVENAAVPSYDATDERKAKLLAECRLAALNFYEQAQKDIRDSGFRVTQRVKDIIWRTLTEIRDRQAAPCVLSRSDVSNIAMTTGGEKKHPMVIMEGRRKQWVGIGWVDEGNAAPSDKAKFPLVVD